jgi:hypothetical protein
VVEAHVVERDPRGLDAEVAGQPALEPDRHVAQPDGVMPGVQQRLGNDSHRVGEVQDPRPGSASPCGLLGDLEDQRHRAQGLREAAWPGGLLADEAELQRQGLVDEASGLAADAELDQRVRRAVEGGRPVAGQRQPAGQPARRRIRPASPPTTSSRSGSGSSSRASSWAPRRASGEALDQLGRVRAAAADDRDLEAHPPLAWA